MGGGVKSAGGGAGITGFGGKRLLLRLHFRLRALLFLHCRKPSCLHESHANLLFAAYYTTNHPPPELPPDFAKCGGSENHSLQTMNIGLEKRGRGPY